MNIEIFEIRTFYNVKNTLPRIYKNIRQGGFHQHKSELLCKVLSELGIPWKSKCVSWAIENVFELLKRIQRNLILKILHLL